MRPFLIALFSLLVVAMTQSVVVVTPIVADVVAVPALEMRAAPRVRDNRFVPSASDLDRDVPTPATAVLLLAGLSGLTAMSGRKHDRKNRASA